MWPIRTALLTPEIKELMVQMASEQERLRQQIVTRPLPATISIVAGCDSAIKDDKMLSVFVNFTYPDLDILEYQWHAATPLLPYIPGFLSFREIPTLVAAYSKLRFRPDVVMVDGQGILHPRMMGIATQLGIQLGLPTIGVAKKKLVGNFEPVAEDVGSISPLHFKQQTLGYAYRSKHGVKPIFISPGHLSDLDSALQLTQRTVRKHKLPEPTRIADIYSKKLKSHL